MRVLLIASLLLIAMTGTGFDWVDPVYENLRDGNERYEAGEFEEAHQEYAEAQAEDPESDTVRYNLGTAWYKQGKFEKAIEEFNQVDAGANSELEAKALYNRGNALFQLGQGDPENMQQHWEQALNSYKDALTIKPDLNPAKHNLEVVRQKLQQLEQQQQQQQNQQGENQEDQQDQESQEGEQNQENSQDQQNQQQQDSDSQQGDQQNDQQQSGQQEEQESSEDQQDQPQQGDESGEQDDQEQQASPGDQDESQSRDGSQQQLAQVDPQQMTEEEAERLLQALQNMEEQGERLPFRLPARGDSSEYDW